MFLTLYEYESFLFARLNFYLCPLQLIVIDEHLALILLNVNLLLFKLIAFLLSQSWFLSLLKLLTKMSFHLKCLTLHELFFRILVRLDSNHLLSILFKILAYHFLFIELYENFSRLQCLLHFSLLNHFFLFLIDLSPFSTLYILIKIHLIFFSSHLNPFLSILLALYLLTNPQF